MWVCSLFKLHKKKLTGTSDVSGVLNPPCRALPSWVTHIPCQFVMFPVSMRLLLYCKLFTRTWQGKFPFPLAFLKFSPSGHFRVQKCTCTKNCYYIVIHQYFCFPFFINHLNNFKLKNNFQDFNPLNACLIIWIINYLLQKHKVNDF